MDPWNKTLCNPLYDLQSKDLRDSGLGSKLNKGAFTRSQWGLGIMV